MNACFVIEPDTKILAVLQAGDAKDETFGLAYAQPNGRVVIRFRHRDRNGSKSVTRVENEDNMVGEDESVRLLSDLADRLRREGTNAYCCSATSNRRLFDQWRRLFGLLQTNDDPDKTESPD